MRQEEDGTEAAFEASMAATLTLYPNDAQIGMILVLGVTTAAVAFLVGF